MFLSSLLLAGYLQYAGLCCQNPEEINRFSGTACPDVYSINTMLMLYEEHRPGDERAAEEMVTSTHQCALVVINKPLYIVYRSKWVYGKNGPAQAYGLSLNANMPPFMYVIMAPQGISA